MSRCVAPSSASDSSDPSAASYAVDFAAVQEAARRIAPHARITPVMTCAAIDASAQRQLFFKCEMFQRVGAFKFRGACNAVLKLQPDVAARGVVTHSSGNHGQALALAASLHGITAHIVMPRNAPKVKRDAVAGYGGIVHLCEPTYIARKTLTESVVASTGAELIPPYDHPDIIAGQGTIALELLEQAKDLDALVVPVGGGGMLSGVAIAARAINPRIRTFAGEPKGADDVARSMAAGELIEQTSPNTIADGLLTSLCETTWAVVRDHVESVVTVSEQQIIDAMRLVFERMKVVVEPSGAVALAAAMTDEFKAMNGMQRVGIVLSGGNVDLERLPWMAG